MFPSCKVFPGSRDESEATPKSEQGLGHVEKTNSSQDFCIQTSVQDQLTKSSSTRIGARIGAFDENS